MGISDVIVAVGTGFLSAPGRFRLAVSASSTEVLILLPLVIVPLSGAPVDPAACVLPAEIARRDTASGGPAVT